MITANNSVMNRLCKIAIGLFVPMVILTGCKNPISKILSDDPEIGVIVDEEFPTAEDALKEDALIEDASMEEALVEDAETSEPVETSESVETSEPAESSGGTIVWLGDSLTQGSLGDDNDNFANAPYLRLAELSRRNVEGYGFYGYNTHDIFWVYSDEAHENQRKDPNKTYIFWVGSNDWVVNGVANDNAAPVISEIDRFVASGGINNFLVLGTTARHELRSDSEGTEGAAEAETNVYETINSQLREHYGIRYLDVNPAIPISGGYGPDNVHLTQQSYDDVADLVDRKLKELGI